MEMNTISIKDKDLGLNRILSDVDRLSNASIDAGILSTNNRTMDDGTTVAEYAFFNEIGTKNIPARPFIASTSDNKGIEWDGLIRRGFKRVLAGNLPIEHFFVGIGQRVVGDIKKTITNLSNPPNKPSTIARKKSSNPLIDTGLMRQLVAFEVKGL